MKKTEQLKLASTLANRKLGLDIERGDCLDSAIAAALSASSLGIGKAYIEMLVRYEGDDVDALIHANARVDGELISPNCEMDNLYEHMDFIVEEKEHERRRVEMFLSEDEEMEEDESHYEVCGLSVERIIEDPDEAFYPFSENSKTYDLSRPIYEKSHVEQIKKETISLFQELKFKEKIRQKIQEEILKYEDKENFKSGELKVNTALMNLVFDLRFKPDEKRVHLWDINVSNELRGLGIGGKVLESVVEVAEEEGFVLTLDARPYEHEHHGITDDLEDPEDPRAKEFFEAQLRLCAWYAKFGFDLCDEGDHQMASFMQREPESIKASLLKKGREVVRGEYLKVK